MIPAPRLDLAAAAPLILVSIGAFVVLLGEIFLKSRKSLLGRPVTPAYVGSALMLVSVFFLLLVVAVAAQSFAAGGSGSFNLDHPMIRLDRFAGFATVVVCVASLLSLLLSKAYLDELRIQGDDQPEGRHQPVPEITHRSPRRGGKAGPPPGLVLSPCCASPARLPTPAG